MIRALYQDRHGYLWFGALNGLARFDGERFTNYGARDGLPGPSAEAIAEDRQGRLWVGTNGNGVARLVEDRLVPGLEGDARAAHRPKFVTYRVDASEESNIVSSIAFDADGAMWCLTRHGLYRADPETLRFTSVLRRGPFHMFMPLLVDSQGRVWAGMNQELVKIERGRVTHWKPPDPVAALHVRYVVEDSRGRILAATNHRELFEYLPPVGGTGRGDWRRLPLTLAPRQSIISLGASRDGVLWIGTAAGLIRYVDGDQVLYTSANGLRNDFIWAIREDREGTLWLGTNDGPVRLPAEHTTSWKRRDGLGHEDVGDVFEAGTAGSTSARPTVVSPRSSTGGWCRCPSPGPIGR